MTCRAFRLTETKREARLLKSKRSIWGSRSTSIVRCPKKCRSECAEAIQDRDLCAGVACGQNAGSNRARGSGSNWKLFALHVHDQRRHAIPSDERSKSVERRGGKVARDRGGANRNGLQSGQTRSGVGRHQ